MPPQARKSSNGAAKAAPVFNVQAFLDSAGVEKNVVQYGPSMAGIASNAKPAAATSGPRTSGMRGPTRTPRSPAQRLIAEMSSTKGKSAAPAAVGL